MLRITIARDEVLSLFQTQFTSRPVDDCSGGSVELSTTSSRYNLLTYFGSGVLWKGCYQPAEEDRCMNTKFPAEQRARETDDRIKVPELDARFWEADQIVQDFGEEKQKTTDESTPGCSGISSDMVLTMAGSDRGRTVTELDQDIPESTTGEPKHSQGAEGAAVRGFPEALVSKTQVAAVAMFSAIQSQEAELLQLNRGMLTAGENELVKLMTDNRGRQELAGGDKESVPSPPLTHKDIGLVVLEEGGAQAFPLAEGHMGVVLERTREPQPTKDSEVSPMGSKHTEKMELSPGLGLANNKDKGQGVHFRTSSNSGASRDSEKVPLSPAQSEVKSDEDDDVFVSARESEQSVTSEISKGDKSANLLTLAAMNQPEFEYPWTSQNEVTDIFSSQFEHIMECQQLKGTSYNSLDSLDMISSTDESECGFSFEMPLTPLIQQRIKEESSHFLDDGLLETALGGQALQRTVTDLNGTLESSTEESTNTSVLDNAFHKYSPSSIVNGAPHHLEMKEERRKGHSTSSECGLKEMRPDGDLEAGSMEQFSHHSGIDVVTNGNKSDLEAARRLAKRLYNLEGFKRSDVARHLGKNNEFSKLVAEEYLRFFDFTGLSLDQSLRYFLKAFALMGETQERERVLIHFSNRYYQCNRDSIPSQDGVHCLTCALMLLNTDLHGHNIGKKMTCQDFINNLDGLNGGKDFPKDLLKALYNSIKNEKLEWAINEEELRKSLSELANDKTDNAGSKTSNRIGSSTNPFLDIPQDPNAKTYKAGFLSRKIHADMDGKKTPRGKRGWKTFYAVLKGMILYLQKDEYKPEKNLSEEDLKNAVSIHHTLAIKATEYEKRPNVFKLKTADWRVFLFQAQSPEEMESWINKMNLVAAIFSAPPFPAAIGSQKRFSRPLLPATTTKMSQEDQMKSHEAKLKQISTELTEHRSYPPDKKVKAKEIDEYRLKEHYLEFEKTRYETYVQLLKDGGQEILNSMENDGSGMKKSHSSPSLNQEMYPVNAKVKRNVSERKDHRPETANNKQKS
ncbi:PH and SEC7 domain-containing protein 1 isoform X2 [Narcine bancroftii]|uniref:PH and SEC7 domain-containing protein 1 isoform X2 n=1 Tax=Narcine bancroftii TaxID=1343680 RepID=UPI003831A9A3